MNCTGPGGLALCGLPALLWVEQQSFDAAREQFDGYQKYQFQSVSNLGIYPEKITVDRWTVRGNIAAHGSAINETGQSGESFRNSSDAYKNARRLHQLRWLFLSWWWREKDLWVYRGSKPVVIYAVQWNGSG